MSDLFFHKNFSVQIPELSSYSPVELNSAAHWPAISRYLSLLQRSRDPNSLTPAALLRLKRHEFWLRSAIATYFNKIPAEQICEFWSEAADALIHWAWVETKCDQAGMALLALGKLGARELNLSSDVDLILLRGDDTQPNLKVFRDFQNLLSNVSEFGFCLRTDFNLRPGGRSAPAIPSISEFVFHYGYHGEMWERLAYVRMRILEGPLELQNEISTFAKKFSFRKHIDYTLLDELKALRQKIKLETFDARKDFFHLKLGDGGIRELELFVHSLQVIHGGRNKILQNFSTTAAIDSIQRLNLLPESDCKTLNESYWYLRTLENRLHAFEDQQNYSIDLTTGHPSLLDDFKKNIGVTREKIMTITTSLFGSESFSNSIPIGLERQQEWLQKQGFSSASAIETWPALLAATALSRKSDRDEKARLEFLQGFVIKLTEINNDRDLGLSLLLDFVRAVRAKASFFTLLNRESNVRDELAGLFSISPYLGSMLATRPELIDEFIYRRQAGHSSDFNILLEELAERRLLSELVAGSRFLADRDLRKLTLNLTSNADDISTTLLKQLLQQMNNDLKTSDIGLIALGKWGGRELGLRSDLDFIFVTPSSPSVQDHKFAKRFLARMTEPHRGGSIYSVDMRLRPSGNAGPIMVPREDLKSYLSNQAAAWERQAYLRSRALCELGFNPAQVGAARGLSPDDYTELKMIRSRLFGKAPIQEVDLKFSYGGLADIEFTCQIALLARREFSLDPSTSGMIEYLEDIDAKWRTLGQELRASYEELRTVEQLFQLTTSQSGSKIRVNSDEFKRLALLLNSTPVDLEKKLRQQIAEVSTHLVELSDLA